MEELPVFDICGPLPEGTTLLEASAGTGKTWTIGALVTRFVAEGEATLDEMLVVTFGRAASQELRERVRAQLVAAEHALAEPDTPTEDDLVRLLRDADPDEVRSRRHRLREALASFDGATIATTHQFCQLVLRSLGVAGDSDSTARLVEDLEDLLAEVVDDIYLLGFVDEAEPAFTHAEAMRIARQAALANGAAHLEPEEVDPKSPAGRRVNFARAVRREMEHRKRRLGILGYDDLLSQLATALEDPASPARQRMRRRWRVVLVDEFQDTDPVQWQVLDRAFTGHARMVLIGDPKQAIYAFRGGDVVTYLQAARTAGTRMTLGTNWRSDGPLVDALQAVLRGTTLGEEGIVVHPIRAARDASRITGAPQDAPFRLRVVSRETVGGSKKSLPLVGTVRQHIARDVAHDIKALLAAGATFDDGEEVRPLRPSDVAVLSHAGDRLADVRAALQEVGLPSVLSGGGTVFSTPGALDWLTLLEALEQPHRSARVRAAALTPFLGHTAVDLEEGGDDLTDRLARRLRRWAEVLDRRGVAAVLEAATLGGMPERVLRRTDGERLLTDLRHVGQALHEAAVTERLGLVALLGWLRDQVAEDRREGPSARTRRLDSDAAAVQLVTIHGSKGLQYPVVYVPFLSERWVPRKVDIPLFHGPEPDRVRSIDVGGQDGPTYARSLGAHLAEDAGESLRLLYVALTRAQSQVVAWWAPSTTAKTSSLHRVLLGREPGQSVVPDEARVPQDDEVAQRLRTWAALGGPVLERAEPPAAAEVPLPVRPTDLQVRAFGRPVDTDWRRTSYTALSRAADPTAVGAVGSEPEATAKEDEPPQEEPLEGIEPLPDHPAAAVRSPMADLPVGATFGSLVHAVLEEADPHAPDLAAELATQVREQLVRWPVDLDPDHLARALVRVCDSPLGPLADTTLRRVGRTDRLTELEFELPLAGGDVRGYPAAEVVLGDIAGLLRRHLPVGDPLLRYADQLEAQPALAEQVLRGYLTGSVDVVLRVGDRYLVADYKTNWLGPADAELTAWAYRPEALAEAMGHSDYPLQALLYAVVLHRYLRWRQAGYDPERHLGGVLYLYLRGMCGPDTPVIDGHPCGVFSWRPPVALVAELSDLLDGWAPARGGAA